MTRRAPEGGSPVYWLGIYWTPAMVSILRLLLDRCEPHGNFKPCVHCEHRHALGHDDRR